MCDSVDTPIHVSMPNCDSLIVDKVNRSCIVMFIWYLTLSNLMILKIMYFDIILRMGSLSHYYAIMDCHPNIVAVAMIGMARLE